jgi:circadian clock protein KaiB
MTRGDIPPTGPATHSFTAPTGAETYSLALYITGPTPRSALAISAIRKICDAYLLGSYSLEIIDLTQEPLLARSEQIVATPTLIRRWPLPIRRFIGDMSLVERSLLGKELPVATGEPPQASSG